MGLELNLGSSTASQSGWPLLRQGLSTYQGASARPGSCKPRQCCANSELSQRLLHYCVAFLTSVACQRVNTCQPDHQVFHASSTLEHSSRLKYGNGHLQRRRFSWWRPPQANHGVVGMRSKKSSSSLTCHDWKDFGKGRCLLISWMGHLLRVYFEGFLGVHWGTITTFDVSYVADVRKKSLYSVTNEPTSNVQIMNLAWGIRAAQDNATQVSKSI